MLFFQQTSLKIIAFKIILNWFYLIIRLDLRSKNASFQKNYVGDFMSGSKLEPVLAHIDANIEIATEHLFDLLRIPSISTDPNFKVDCDTAADWLVQDLKSIGFDASKRITPGHPMVLAHAGETGIHLMFYGVLYGSLSS